MPSKSACAKATLASGLRSFSNLIALVDFTVCQRRYTAGIVHHGSDADRATRGSRPAVNVETREFVGLPLRHLIRPSATFWTCKKPRKALLPACPSVQVSKRVSRNVVQRKSASERAARLPRGPGRAPTYLVCRLSTRISSRSGPCVYREPKLERSDGEVHQEWRVI
jgi:hypothetical protein